jgi:hypothetical protein
LPLRFLPKNTDLNIETADRRKSLSAVFVPIKKAGQQQAALLHKAKSQKKIHRHKAIP